MKKNQFYSHILTVSLLLCAALLGGGCTTTSTDPYAMTTGDMLLGKGRMADTLAQKRLELAGLQKDLKSLDDELFDKRASLHAFQRELEKASVTDRELQGLLTQVKQDQIKADALSDQLLATQSRISKVEQLIESNHANQQLYTRELQMLKEECSSLQVQHQAIVKALNRTLKLRAELETRAL